jgi:hypothetical protein
MPAHAPSHDLAVSSGTSPKRRGGIRKAHLVDAFLRAHLLALCIILGLILLYTLAGLFLVPYLARTAAEQYVTEQLHRTLALGEITFNPFTFQSRIYDLTLSEADGRVIGSFKALLVNAELASLWQRAIVLKEVRLEDPGVDVIVERDGSVNLARLAPASTETKPMESDSPPRVRIGSLTVANGRINLEDHSRAAPFQAAFAPIHFALEDFRTDLYYKNAYAFSATSMAGEQLDWSGNFTVQPLGSVGEFAIKNLRAQTIDTYVQEQLPFKLASGAATLNGAYRLAIDPVLTLDVQLPIVALHDLTLMERGADGNAPISLPKINVSDVALSYGQRQLTCKEVEVADARVDLWREPDGTINLIRLANQNRPEVEAVDQTTASTHPSSSVAASDWNLRVDALRVTNSAILAEDRTVSPAVKIAFAPASFSILNISTDPNTMVAVDADLTINELGRVQVDGDVQVEPLGAQLAVDLSDFRLPVLQPYIAQMSAMTLHSGKLDVRGDVTLAATEAAPTKLSFEGDIGVTDLRTTDQFVKEDFVRWRSLTVNGLSFEQNPDRLTIEKITARGPYARVIIAPDRTLNVARVLRLDEDSESQPTPSSLESLEGEDRGDGSRAQRPSRIRIKSVQVIDGSANFADYSIEPSFATGILGLDGTVTGLSSDPTSRAKVQLKGDVDQYAPVDITGEVNLLAAAKYTDLAMNFRNMELTTFNPYSGKFAGYNITRGKLSTELKYEVEDRQLNAEHHIVLDSLEFGAKTDSKDVAPIPIKLAVALLKDRNGVIDIQLPVSGTLDDPAFRLGPIIWKAFLGLLTKVVTSPFAAIGALFGGGDELAYVEFASGSAEITTAELDKLGKLAKALAERPQLRLDVPLTLANEQDAAALAQKTLNERARPETSDALDDAAKRRRLAQLEKIYESVAKAAPEYPPETKTESGVDWDARVQWIQRALLDKLKPDQSALDALARQRAQAVRTAVLANTEVHPARVFITTDRSAAVPSPGIVRMEMKLE